MKPSANFDFFGFGTFFGTPFVKLLDSYDVIFIYKIYFIFDFLTVLTINGPELSLCKILGIQSLERYVRYFAHVSR